MTRTQLRAAAQFRATPRRRMDAELWLERVLAEWQLQAGLAGRWLASAERHFRHDDELTLTAEYDQDLRLFSVEVWRGGARLYGLDDLLD